MIRTIYDDRREQYKEEKKLIGAYVAYYLRKYALNKSISIDGGSTNFEVISSICKDIKDRKRSVSSILTNHLEGIYLAKDFHEGEGPTWRCTGGILRTSRKTFIQINEAQFKEIRTWVAVVGINGFEPPFLQTTSQVEHEVKKAMIEAARYVVFPMDSYKWGCTAAENLININDMMIAKQRVSIVTCFPIRHTTEPENDFNIRVSNFLDGLMQYYNFFRCEKNYISRMYTAKMKDSIVDVIDQEVNVNKISPEFIRDYAKKELSGSAYTGLVLRSDLWEGNIGSSDF